VPRIGIGLVGALVRVSNRSSFGEVANAVKHTLQWHTVCVGLFIHGWFSATSERHAGVVRACPLAQQATKWTCVIPIGAVTLLRLAHVRAGEPRPLLFR